MAIKNECLILYNYYIMGGGQFPQTVTGVVNAMVNEGNSPSISFRTSIRTIFINCFKKEIDDNLKVTDAEQLRAVQTFETAEAEYNTAKITLSNVENDRKKVEAAYRFAVARYAVAGKYINSDTIIYQVHEKLTCIVATMIMEESCNTIEKTRSAKIEKYYKSIMGVWVKDRRATLFKIAYDTALHSLTINSNDPDDIIVDELAISLAKEIVDIDVKGLELADQKNPTDWMKEHAQLMLVEFINARDNRDNARVIEYDAIMHLKKAKDDYDKALSAKNFFETKLLLAKAYANSADIKCNLAKSISDCTTLKEITAFKKEFYVLYSNAHMSAANGFLQNNNIERAKINYKLAAMYGNKSAFTALANLYPCIAELYLMAASQ